MTDDELVKLVWEVMVLKRRFEDDPYSLTLEEIKIVKQNEKHRIRQSLLFIDGVLKVEYGGSRPFQAAKTHHIQKKSVGERIKVLD